MYQRSDGRMTGNVQQGRHFDRMAHGEKSRTSIAKPGSEPPHEEGAAPPTESHPASGAHEIHIKHHGGGKFSVHVFHEAIAPHPEAHKAEMTQHDGNSMREHVDTEFPNDGDETSEEHDGATKPGIFGNVSEDDGTNERGY